MKVSPIVVGKTMYTLIEQAKTEETRQKRIDKAIADLKVGKT